MLYENQVHGFLEHCEAKISRKLSKLRSDLGAEDKHGALWELITLYIASKVSDVDHEPREATPDVLVSPAIGGEFWIEAKHVKSRGSKHSEHLSRLSSWLSSELKKQNVDATSFLWHFDELPEEPATPALPPPPRTNLLIRLIGRIRGAQKLAVSAHEHDKGVSKSRKSPIVLPPTKAWKNLKRTKEWNAFVEDLRLKKVTKFDAKTSGFSCRFTAEPRGNPHGYLISNHAALQIDEFNVHPVYRSIKDKASQAKKWKIGEAPLVVCIGSTDELGFLELGDSEKVTAIDAATAALHDADVARQIPCTSRNVRSLVRKLRVSGSGRISAVLLVSVEDRSLGVLMGSERTARPRLVINHQAAWPLSDAQRRLLESLPFDAIQFANDAESQIGHRNRKNRKRANHGKKTLNMPGHDEANTEIIIPEQDFLWVLAGKAKLFDVLRNYDCEHLAPMFEEEPPLVDITRVPGNPEAGEPDRIRIVVGKPRERLY